MRRSIGLVTAALVLLVGLAPGARAQLGKSRLRVVAG